MTKQTSPKAIKHTYFESISLHKIDNNTRIINEKACYNTDLEEVIFPKDLEIIHDNAFEKSKLKNIEIPNQIAIGYAAFAKIKTLSFVDINCKYISSWAFM